MLDLELQNEILDNDEKEFREIAEFENQRAADEAEMNIKNMTICAICGKDTGNHPLYKRIENESEEMPICNDCDKKAWPITCPCGCTFIPLDEDQADCPDCGIALERVVN